MENKYEVKRLDPETVIAEFSVKGGTAGFKSPNHFTYAVFENGKITKEKNGEFCIYPSKNVAIKQAEYMGLK